ncbi:ABC transporter substrate-binding protein [Paenibacillus kobensis]|uniref:ABC transporter substrate-binding protein n=1 Tax=Paenibacillus kobensis TaxID=59841 RepID=UPI001FE6C54C|nr:ABC transporter substrate-binding protein [Paenibacillus kobensis]
MRNGRSRCGLIGGGLSLFIMACITLAGCTSERVPNVESAVQPEEPVTSEQTITMLTNRVDLIENGQMDKYAEPFEIAHPGTKIRFEGLANYTADIMVKLSTRSMPDVLLLPTNLLSQDLPRYFEPLDDSMFEGMRFADYKSYQGLRYGLSTGASTVGIAYNKKAFQAAGITALPTTLDAFYDACRKLKAAGITPIYLNYGAGWPMKLWGEELVSFMTGDPAYLNAMVKTDAPWQLDNAWGQAMTIVKTLIARGYTESNLMANQWEASKSKVASGEAAMYFNGNWIIQQVIDAGAKPDDIGFFPMPYDNGTKHYAPLLPDWFVGISKFSSNIELAQAWIEYFVKESSYVEDSGFLPMMTSKEPALRQFQQFLSFSPTFVETESPSDLFLELAEKAQIPFWSGEYIQEWVVSNDLQSKFEAYNEKWKLARESVIPAVANP